MYLTACDARLASQAGRRFARSWLGLMGLSIATGLGLVGLWGAAWRILGDYGLLVMPATAAAIGLLVWPMRHGLASLARIIGREGLANRAMVVSVVSVVVMTSLVCLRPDWYRAEYAMPPVLAWLRPDAKIYRVLILMPVWGCWAMLIALQFCRPGEGTDAATRALADGCGPAAAAACMAVPLAGSVVYMHYLGAGAQWTVPAVTVVAAIATGPILCRLAGGPTRSTLLAGNLLTQLVFLVTFLAFQ